MIESAPDLLAAIRGFCFGLERFPSTVCFADFPAFVQSNFPEVRGQRWLDTLTPLCADKSLHDACGFIQDLLTGWKQSNPTVPALNVDTPTRSGAIEVVAFDQTEAFLRNPRAFLPELSTLREALLFVWGIRIRGWPPMGEANGTFELSAHINHSFGESPVLWSDAVLSAKLAGYPVIDACRILADLVCDWRQSRERSQ
jgi:hypothetical protein